ncbi:MAG: ASCH domain-containing protein [Treponema sp.]|nr:ASCH domain-containing protein [Candidatus Treponema equifaecale]
MSKASEYWNEYLTKTGQKAEEAGFTGELCFEDSGFNGMEKLNLILSGRKTAIFSAFDSYIVNREPVPVCGEVYIVEDGEKNPKCIIEVTDVNILPFCDISWNLAQREGEDENFSQWREKQIEYMKDEADLCGFDFNEGSRVVCQIFQVIYRA